MGPVDRPRIARLSLIGAGARASVVVILFIWLGLACGPTFGGGGGGPSAPPDPTYISIYPPKARIEVGDSVGFRTSFSTDLWSSTDSNVIAIEWSGFAVARGAGAARIVARREGGYSDTAEVVVLAPSMGLPFEFVASGDMRSCARPSGGDSLVCWPAPPTSTGWGPVYTDSGGRRVVLPDLPRFTRLDIGDSHACGLLADGTAWCWGDNALGGLGTGDRTARTRPTPVDGDRRYTRIGVAGGHSCAIAADSTAWCWGDNFWSALGDSAIGSWALTPNAVTGGRRFVDIAVGHSHSCAIRVDAVVMCWGHGEMGELGVDLFESKVPVAVTGNPTAVRITVGQFHSCLLDAAGAVRCWGSNWSGELGDGGLPSKRTVPVTVLRVPTFAAVEADGRHTCALSTAGAVWCWGTMYDRERLDAYQVHTSQPTLVSGSLTFTRLAVGYDFACGITTTGELKCWGDNAVGSIGDGTNMPRVIPHRVRYPEP